MFAKQKTMGPPYCFVVYYLVREKTRDADPFKLGAAQGKATFLFKSNFSKEYLSNH